MTAHSERAPDTAAPDSPAPTRSTPWPWQAVALGLCAMLLLLGWLAMSLQGDPWSTHARLARDIQAPLAAGAQADVRRILEDAQRSGRISGAVLRDADGVPLLELASGSDTDRRTLQVEGPLTVNGLRVGTLSIRHDDGPHIPVLFVAALGIAALTGFSLAAARLARESERSQQQRAAADLVRALDGAGSTRALHAPALPAGHPLQPVVLALERMLAGLERRSTQQDARLNRLERIVRAQDNAHWEWDLTTGETWHCARFPALLGYGEEDAFDQQFRWSAATHPDDAGTVRRARERLFRREIERSDDPIRLRVRDGTYRWFRLRASAEHDAAGTPVRASGTIEDITRERMTLDALRESEARLFHAVRGSFDGAWDWDIGAGRYFLSPRLSEILGLPQSQQPQTHDQLLERVHPDDLSRLQHAIDEHFLRRESFDIEYRMRHESGHYLWVRDRGLATRNAVGKVLRFSGSITDITERKFAEQAIRALVTEKQALFDDVPVAIVYVRSDRIADCNRRCEEIFGHSRSALLGRTVDLFFRNGVDLPQLLDGAVRAAPQPHAQEATLLRRDGSPLHAYVSVRQLKAEPDEPAETIWIFSDDTARRRALETARREENFSAALVRSMPGVFFLLDARGALRRWNENLQAITGQRALDLIGKRALDLFPDSAHGLLRRQARRALTHRDSTFEAGLIAATGESVPHAFSLYRIDLDGMPHLLGTGLDIRVQKDAERSVLALNQQLETRVRERTAELVTAMRELESFSYSVSHDLAAPLRGIDGFSRMIEEDYAESLDERGREYLQRIRAGTQRMHRLIDDLLGLARITRNEMNRQSVDLSAMVAEVAAELQRSEPSRRSEFLIQPSMRVYADANLLRIGMDNLLRNAWKFTSRHATARIEVGCLQRGRELVYFVKDDGAGFDMRYATKLFGPFQRLHSAGEFSGSGIGLAIVHRIVHRHGGRIWAEAEVERGATFFFTLEAAPQ